MSATGWVQSCSSRTLKPSVAFEHNTCSAENFFFCTTAWRKPALSPKACSARTHEEFLHRVCMKRMCSTALSHTRPRIHCRNPIQFFNRPTPVSCVFRFHPLVYLVWCAMLCTPSTHSWYVAGLRLLWHMLCAGWSIRTSSVAAPSGRDD